MPCKNIIPLLGGIIILFLNTSCLSRKPEKVPDYREEQVVALLEEYARTGRGEETLKALRPLLPYEENPMVYISLYLAEGEVSLAEEALTELLKDDPDNREYLLALIRLKRGEEISVLIQKLLSLDPENPEALIEMGYYWLSQGVWSRAESYLFQALEMNPSAPEALEGLGISALKKKEYEKARTYLKNALALEEKASVLSSLSRACYYSGKKAEAVSFITRAAELEPENYWHRFDRGKIYFYLNETERAEEDFHTVYKADPDHFFTNVFLGRISFYKGDTDKSLHHYNKVMEIQREYYPAWEPLSLLYYMKGELELSLRYQAAEYNRHKGRDHFYSLFMALSLRESGREKEAVTLLKKISSEVEEGSSFRRVCEYYIHPDTFPNDGFNDIYIEKDSYIKNRLLFYLAAGFEREGLWTSAVALYSQVASSDIYFESKLAKKRMEDFSDRN